MARKAIAIDARPALRAVAGSQIVASKYGGAVEDKPFELLLRQESVRSPVRFESGKLVSNLTTEGLHGAMFVVQVRTRSAREAKLTWSASFFHADGQPVPGRGPEFLPGARVAWTTIFCSAAARRPGARTNELPTTSRKFVLPAFAEKKINLFFAYDGFALRPGYYECVAVLKVYHEGSELAVVRVPFNFQVGPAAHTTRPDSDSGVGAGTAETAKKAEARVSRIKIEQVPYMVTARFDIEVQGYAGQDLIVLSQIVHGDNFGSFEGANVIAKRLSCPYELSFYPGVTRNFEILDVPKEDLDARVSVKIVDATQLPVAEAASEVFVLRGQARKSGTGGLGSGGFVSDDDGPGDVQEPYAVLGLAPGCTRAELKEAYRARVQDWHPDRIAHMPPSLRAIATEGMKLINWAKEAIERDLARG